MRYVHAELMKMLYNKWFLIVSAAVPVFVPLMVSTLGAYFGETGDMLLISKFMQGSYLGQVGYAALAALYFGREYQRAALRTSLLVTPRRYLFLISKTACLLIWTAMLFTVTTSISVLVLNVSPDFGPVIGRVFISTMETVMITSSLVLITKSAIVSMAIPISLILGLGNLLLQYGRIFRYLPVTSAMNSFFIFEVPNYPGVIEGLIVQGVWCLLFAAVGGVLFLRRCVR